tara:strand:+ start:7649 stop:8755 length:1107 start_codon:yes stop_codon:yes gene_type:complete
VIPFLDLKKQHQQLGFEINEAMLRVLNSGNYILGDEVKSFEEELSSYLNVGNCIGVSSGLDAIQLIFKGLIELKRLQKGDQVLVPANTYFASILALINCGLKPVLVEPNLQTYNICLQDLKNKTTTKTKAILLVHLYGRSAFSTELIEWIKDHELIAVDDAAQAFGAKWQGKYIGSILEATAFSFFPTKNLGAIGDAGAVATNNRDLARAVMALRNYGTSEKNQLTFIGQNSRLDELQAAVLKVKLKKVEELNKRRRSIAKYYSKNLVNNLIILPQKPEVKEEHVWHLYVIRSNNRKDFKEYLDAAGIETQIHYPMPPHKQAAFKNLGNLKLPITTELHQEVISLPLDPMLENEKVERVVDVINEFKL